MTRWPSKATREAAVSRALTHHMIVGVVRDYSTPYTCRPKWLVTLHNQRRREYTLAQVESVCDALASYEAFARDRRPIE